MYHLQQEPTEISYHVFRLFIATPEKVFYDGQVLSAKIPGIDGLLEILVRHAPLMTTLSEGTVTIIDSDKKRHSWSVRGGYFQIADNRAYLLADQALLID